MLRVIVVLISGLLFFSAALAADNGIYLGVGVSQSSVDVDYGSGAGAIALDGEDTKYKVIVGVRPLDWLAFEANYVDFGSIETPPGVATPGEFKLTGFDAFAIGLFEIGLVDFYAKAGVIAWDQNASIANVPGDDTGYDAAYGAGIQVHFGSLSVRAEYEDFDIENTSSTSLITVGITWTFL
jgi:Outer membrane protein beta-barrel domain